MNELLLVLPPLIFALGGVVLLMVDLAIPRERKSLTAGMAAVVSAAAALCAILQWGLAGSGFQGMISVDGVALALDALVGVIGVLTIGLSLRYNALRGILRGEFFVLMLFSLSGMALIGHAANLLTIFLAIELLSIPLYVLSGIARPRLDSEESAMKYFLLGAFASGFLVFGMALVYGATGQLSLTGIARTLITSTSVPLLVVGAALMLVGLGFKVAAAPFHMWTPDVYQGAPTTVTAFMSTATKAAGFVALLRVFGVALGDLANVWQPAFAALSALTMMIGNLGALTQINLKRMLAYSSIAHAGYLLMGLAAGGVSGVRGVVFYLPAYAAASLAAFAAMTAAHNGEEDQSISAYAGLSRTRPGWALVMAVAMLSLLGIPPTAGFVGKYMLFQSAIDVGLVPLAVIGVLTSVVSGYYYLRVIVTMYFEAPPEGVAVTKGNRLSLHWVTGAIAAAASIVLGILPAPLINAVTAGVTSIR